MSTERSGQQSGEYVRGGSGAASPRMSASSSVNQRGGMTATVTSQIQDALDQQIIRGARTMTSVAKSAKLTADDLQTEAPQIAGLVRGMADRLEEYSRNLETQSATDIYQAATDFTRRQPAVVFGLAALAGFFALRTLKHSSASSARRSPVNSSRGEDFHGS